MKTLYRDDDWYKKKKDVDVEVKVDGLLIGMARQKL
jgi:hypothetical protein